MYKLCCSIADNTDADKIEESHKRVTEREFDNVVSEIRAIVGNRLKEHEDGDVEEKLLEQ